LPAASPGGASDAAGGCSSRRDTVSVTTHCTLLHSSHTCTGAAGEDPAACCGCHPLLLAPDPNYTQPCAEAPLLLLLLLLLLPAAPPAAPPPGISPGWMP
jgi:hypothetical protein